MVQRGVAPATNDILEQLKTKFPKRKNTVRWPDRNRIEGLRHLAKKTIVEMELDECCEDENLLEEDVKVADTPESLLELQKSIENDFQAVQVRWEDIVMVASRAKKSWSGTLSANTMALQGCSAEFLW